MIVEGCPNPACQRVVVKEIISCYYCIGKNTIYIHIARHIFTIFHTLSPNGAAASPLLLAHSVTASSSFIRYSHTTDPMSEPR